MICFFVEKNNAFAVEIRVCLSLLSSPLIRFSKFSSSIIAPFSNELAKILPTIIFEIEVSELFYWQYSSNLISFPSLTITLSSFILLEMLILIGTIVFSEIVANVITTKIASLSLKSLILSTKF
mgnify:CR=1 FL=1